MKMFAGNPSRPSENEFKLMVAAWTETLQDAVPEYKLAEAFVRARRNRNSSFQMDVSEVCGAWQQMKDAQRYLRPSGSYELGTKDVCPHCNGTGTKPVVKHDLILGRDYSYGAVCTH